MPIARVVHFATLSALLLILSFSPQAAEVAGDYRLGVGDRLRITVFGHESLSGKFTVDGAGRVVMPLIGGVVSQGLTTTELARAITARLRPDYLVNPRVSVELLTYRPFYILGEVNKPGDYPYREGMTVLNAVALAGGFAPHAKRNKVLIERNGKRLRAAVGARVEPGDIITVRERFF